MILNRGKVRNATPTEVDNIKFKSKLEAYFYLIAKAANLTAEYEVDSLLLQPAFEFQGERIRVMTYKPDFTVTTDTGTFWIECKGFKTDAYKVRRKLIMYQLKVALESLNEFNRNIIWFELDSPKKIDDWVLAHCDNPDEASLRLNFKSIRAEIFPPVKRVKSDA